MGSGASLLVIISQILIHLVCLTIGQPEFQGRWCTDMGNETSTTSMYRSNLNTVLSSIFSNISQHGFYNSFAGQNSDRVNAIALCRGDLDPDACRSCLNDSTRKLRQVCPRHKEAIGWYGNCMLRYSNRSISQTVDTRPAVFVWLTANFSNVNEFNRLLRELLDSLRGEASRGDSLQKFATGNVSAPPFSNIFALVQCTPDLSELQCSNCLESAVRDISANSTVNQRLTIFTPSCILSYGLYRFYNETVVYAPPPLQPPPPSVGPPEGENDSASQTIIIIVVPMISVILVVCICIWIFIRKKWRKTKEKFDNVDEISSVESLQYDFGTVKVATDYFSESNKLGQGGFGAVYKGRLQTGEEIAVKRLYRGSGQGYLEFKNEILLGVKLQHKHLVRLLGFCVQDKERLLIYEFVPNASLDHFIFDPVQRLYLDWDRRYKIIGGVARGLLYLHESSRLQIIHRDLKASNVLLDAEMNAKISNFGMARLLAQDETQGNTNRIVGTFGYMAPEYAMYGQFSVKSDVFSFGVLVLEIIIGKKNNGFRDGENIADLASYVWKNWREGTISNMIDPTLRTGSRSISEMMRCIHIGLLCVQELAADRPTMASVVLMLNSYSLTLPVPSEPAFFIHSSINPEMPLVGEHNSEASESTNISEITEEYPQ